MIIYVKQDIFKSPAQVLVNTVNTVGVMGKGIAKRYKEVYPDMYKRYREFCEAELLKIGNLWIYKSEDKWILNFPTKTTWKKPSKMEYIELGLEKFVDTYYEKGIQSISFPQLGCGNGGLDWEEVKPVMEKYLKDLPIDVFIHIYDDSNKREEHMNIDETMSWLSKTPASISAKQLWLDLVDISNREFEVANNKWRIENMEDSEIEEGFLDETIKLTSSESSIVISYSEIFEIWSNLRDFGYLLTTDFPIKRLTNKELNVVFCLLSSVEYITPISTQNIKGADVKGLTINKASLPKTNEEDIYELGVIRGG